MKTKLHPHINPVVTGCRYIEPPEEANKMIGGLPADCFTETNGKLQLDATIAEEIAWEIVTRRGNTATIRPVKSTIDINETTYTIDRQKLLCTVKAEFIGHNKKADIKP